MVVRGAPAIGITAAYAVVLAARERYRSEPRRWREAIKPDLEFLEQARPTAVNLRWAVTRMRGVIDNCRDGKPLPWLLDEARRIHAEDIAANRRFCTWLQHWRDCPSPLCRRARACRRIATSPTGPASASTR